MDHFAGYGIGIQEDGAPSLTLVGGVESQSMPLGSQHTAEETAGTTYARQGHVTEIKPRASFGCYNVSDLIGLLGLRGASLAGGAVAGFEMTQLRREQSGEIASGSVHRKLIIPNGAVIPRSISCSHRAPAMMNAEALATYDGTNDPVIITESVAAPTGLDDVFRFTLGSMQVAGVTLNGNLSLEIDFGNSAETEGGDSDVFDSNVEINQIIPTITIRGKDVSKFSASGIPLRGKLATHANTQFVLRRRLRGTADFSDSADHIAITTEGIVAIDEAFSASANRRGEIALKITCLDDGTNAPLVFDTAHSL